MRKTASAAVVLLTVLPFAVQAATEADKARQKLAKDGVLFTTEGFLDVIDDGDKKKVDLFLKAGIDVNGGNERGETPLLEAADSDEPEIVAMLLRAGADVNGRTKDGETAIYRCVKSGRTGGGRVVRGLLLGAKADVNLRYRSGETALHAASSSTNPEAMKALIAAGAQVDARDDHGRTTLYECACTGRTDEMAVLIEAGADVNAGEPSGDTPLMSAAVCGEAAVVTALLAAKANPKIADKNGTTALMQIARFNMHFVRTGRVEEASLTRIVQELIAAGGDPNARLKHDGAPPLLEAVRQDNLAVVTALLAGGANANGKDNYGKTALQEAKDKPEIAAALKAAGAAPAASAKPGPKKK